jgi:hypothetical protein
MGDKNSMLYYLLHSLDRNLLHCHDYCCCELILTPERFREQLVLLLEKNYHLMIPATKYTYIQIIIIWYLLSLYLFVALMSKRKAE